MHNEIHRKLTIAMVLLGIFFGIVAFVLHKADAMVQEVPATCPAGSYEIDRKEDGLPICKLEPTGCPYGDSIPMDMCDKYAPAPQVVEPTPEPVTAPQPVKQECGK